MAKDEKPSDTSTAISVKVPTDLLKKVRAKSVETGVPVSFIVRKALEKWVKGED